ncbi:hypothetical protein DY000_02047331 [Brassica cretica]|uniref:Uncharacterized protein n=1 Tax=Brassica cretica TaxID=69181 RepID=A0ABQ7F8L0_BRACR|nr:hypothetical protein DY000_02047331 [Brassica cretica]
MEDQIASSKSIQTRKVVDCFADLSCLIRQRGCRTAEDNRIVRLRTKMQLEQNREEIHDKRDAKEEDFEMLQQQKRAKVVEQQQKKNTNLSSKDELRKIAEEVSGFIELQEKDMEEFDSCPGGNNSLSGTSIPFAENAFVAVKLYHLNFEQNKSYLNLFQEPKGCVTSLIEQGCASRSVVHVRYKTPMKMNT